MNRKTLENLLAYIDANIQEKLNLKDLADLMGYSPFYFSKLFSEYMGIPVTSYIRIRKMQFALQALLKGKTVMEVALQYGFESHEGFTRSFTQLFGSTPKTAKKYLTAYDVPRYVVPGIDERISMENKRKKHLQDDMYQMAYEILSESLREAKEGYCTQITVEVLPDNYVKISDDGRGLPFVPNDKRNQNVLEKIFGGHPITDLEYGRMGDLAQDGLQVVCSLSQSFCIIVYRDGKEFRQDFIRGIAQHELLEANSKHCSGMEVIFKPDEKIFGEACFNEEILKAWLESEKTKI